MTQKLRVIKLSAICVATLVSFSLFSGEISRIVFQQKGYEFPEQFLRYNLQSREGSEFSRKILDEDIKRLYSTGRFSDIVAETSAQEGGEIEIIFKTSSKPRIKAIIFSGNKKFSEKDLSEHLTIQKDSILDDKELSASLSALRKFYQDKGYNDTVITHTVEAIESGYVNVTISVKENLRLKVNSVSFTGNTAYSSWRLKDSIATRHSWLSWIMNTGLYSKDEAENDKARLRELYWNKGYLDFDVKKVEVAEDASDPEYVNVRFDLDEGDSYKVGRVSVFGNSKFTTEELMSLISLQEGAILDNRIEKEDIKAIRAKYDPLGYADFHCEAVRIPDYKTHIAAITYKITEGVPCTVRDLNISGNVNTKDYVIRREMVIHPGDPVNPDMIDTSKARLMGMNYFEKVDIVTVQVPDPSMKDIDVAVKEKDTGKFAIGGGFSDTDSVVGTLELSQSNFDISDPGNWFVGGGQRVKFTGQYGIERSDFSLDFTEPWLFGIPLSLDVSGFYHDREYEDWSEKTFGAETSLTKRIFDDFTSVGLGYTIASVKIYDMKDDMSAIFQKEKGTDTISKFSLNLSRDTRDSLLDPKSGYLLSALGEFNSKILGASVNMYKFETQASNYYSFIDDMFTLHTGIKLGQADRIGGSGGKLVPIYERYFLGGGDTIRGFPYRAISPIDENEDPYGGESMIIGNIELTHPIYDFIRGAVFVDAGGVWRRAWDIKLDEFNVGAGYGLRIKLPYFSAPVKLDLAYPVVVSSKQKNIKKKLRFHFNLGLTWSP
jgi:outer membrane protein insertion porin family